MENKINIYIKFLRDLKRIIPDFIVSGSIATMIYLNQFTRECNDVDIHFKCKNILNDLKKIERFEYELESISDNYATIKVKEIENFYIKLDINYSYFPFQKEKEINLVKLEKLIADKIIRCSIKTNKFPRAKDLYDLQFLLKLPYDKSLVFQYMLKNLKDYNVENGYTLFIEKQESTKTYSKLFQEYIKNTNVFYEFDRKNTICNVVNIIKEIRKLYKENNEF